MRRAGYFGAVSAAPVPALGSLGGIRVTGVVGGGQSFAYWPARWSSVGMGKLQPPVSVGL